MKSKVSKIINNERVFWFGVILFSIWLVFFMDYLINKDFNNSWKKGGKYSLIVLGILLIEFLYKKIGNYFKE